MAATDLAGDRSAPVIDAEEAAHLRAARLERTLRWLLPLPGGLCTQLHWRPGGHQGGRHGLAAARLGGLVASTTGSAFGFACSTASVD